MYKSPELQEATDKLINCARDRNILLGMFQVSVLPSRRIAACCSLAQYLVRQDLFVLPGMA
eukprot:SAG31_NODE_77_length_27533_cov_47.448859_1_plen_61_part_10